MSDFRDPAIITLTHLKFDDMYILSIFLCQITTPQLQQLLDIIQYSKKTKDDNGTSTI